jgi:hypothetical protein
MYASIYDQITKEFGCSQEVAILGLSLFVIGLAIASMVLSPLSEVLWSPTRATCIESILEWRFHV